MSRFTPRTLARKLWHDDLGTVLSLEITLVITILVLGLVPGLIALRQGTLTELVDLANSFMALDQSYSFSGQQLVCADCENCNRHDGRGNRDTHDGVNSRDGANGKAATGLHNGNKGFRLTDRAAGTDDARQGDEGNGWHRHTKAWSAGSSFLNRKASDDNDSARDADKAIHNASTPASSKRITPVD